ncbi:hypothetical protein [Sutcliffiella cohnii]|nr:hypothetical protein [Sutcliffiella cohnii]
MPKKMSITQFKSQMNKIKRELHKADRDFNRELDKLKRTIKKGI